MTYTLDSIGTKLKELRQAVGWSQWELARKAHVTAAAISMIEKSDRIPSLPTIIQLAGVLGVSISELLGDVPTSLDNADKQFLRKFRDLKALSEVDQQLILTLIKRLGVKTGGKKNG